MSLGGWMIMLLSVGTVTVLFAWSLYKVLSAPDTPPGGAPETETEPEPSPGPQH